MKQRILLLLNTCFCFGVLHIQAQSNVFPSNGSVGFGTTAPAYPVHQQVSFPDGYAHVIENTSTNVVRWKIMNATAQGAFEVAVNGNGNTIIQTGKNNNTTQTLSILSGNIGIGTLSPVYPFDVSGAMHSYVNSGSNLFLSKPSGASIAFDNGSGANTALIESGSPLVGNRLEFWTNTSTNSGLVERMRIDDQGNVAIGTTYTGSYKLAVEGTVGVRKLKVTQVSPWADFVFDPSYELKPLSQVESFIKKNGHLPEVPSAKEIEKNGIEVGETAALLLKKIEELTLYMIDIKKENRQLKEEVRMIKREIEKKK